MSKDENDEPIGDTPIRDALRHHWNRFARWYSGLSALVRDGIAFVAVIVSTALTLFGADLSAILPSIPNASNTALLLGMIALLLVQTWYHRQRFNQLAEEVKSMGTPDGVVTDGGEPDAVGVLLLVLSGAIFGIAFAQTYSPDYVVPIALMGAWLMARTFGDL